MKKENVQNNDHFMVTTTDQIKEGFENLKKQFRLMERDEGCLYGVLDYIRDEVYIPNLRDAYKVPYKTMNIEHFINNLRYMDYLYNSTTDYILNGLTETQALIAISYSEISMLTNKRYPLRNKMLKCYNGRKLFIEHSKLDTIPLSKIDRSIIEHGLDIASSFMNLDVYYLHNTGIVLAKLIMDILNVGHYVLGDTIDVRQNVQDLTDDLNLWHSLWNNKDKKKYSFKSVFLTFFYFKFSKKSNHTFKWYNEIDDEIQEKYSMFQDQIEQIYDEVNIE